MNKMAYYLPSPVFKIGDKVKLTRDLKVWKYKDEDFKFINIFKKMGIDTVLIPKDSIGIITDTDGEIMFGDINVRNIREYLLEKID